MDRIWTVSDVFASATASRLRIEELIGNNIKSWAVYRDLINHCERLELILSKADIKDSGRSLQEFEHICQQAKTFMGMN